MTIIRVLPTVDRSQVLADLADEPHVTVVTSATDTRAWRVLADGSGRGPSVVVIDAEHQPAGPPLGAIVVDRLARDVDVTELAARASQVVVLTGAAGAVPSSPEQLVTAALERFSDQLAAAGHEVITEGDWCCCSADFRLPDGATLSVYVTSRTERYGKSTPLSVGWPATVEVFDSGERTLQLAELDVRSVGELTALLTPTLLPALALTATR